MSKKLVDKRNKQIHKIVLCMRDPTIMLCLGANLMKVWDVYVGITKDRVKHPVDMMMLAWAARHPYFKKKAFQEALKEIDPYFIPNTEHYASINAMLGRMKKRKWVDRAVYKGSQTWFITTEGKLFLIDVTNAIRKLTLELLVKAKTPEGMRWRKFKSMGG